MARFCSFGLVVLFLYFCVATAPAQQQFRKDSFQTSRMVSGEIAIAMERDEVEERLGQPHKISALEGDERWDYYEYDPNGRAIATAFVIFREGRVVTFDRHQFAAIQRRRSAPYSENARCLTGSDGLIVCNRSPNAECREGSDGHAACGFDCKQSPRGYVACAQKSDQICRVGADGDIACGYDCWTSLQGQAVCEQNRYEGGR